MTFLVMPWYIRSLLVLLQTVNVAQGLARFTKVPPSVLYVSEGSTAKFVWDYIVDDITTEFEESSPMWFFDNAENNSEEVIVYESAFEGKQWKISNKSCPPRLLNPTRVSKESNATLVIRNVSKSDNGVYGCRLNLKDPKQRPITSKVLLVVTSTPKLTRKHVSSRTISEGQSLSINCSAFGDPTPNITWLVLRGVTKEIKSQGLGSARLSIQNITRNQSGRYECQATNNPNESPVTWEIVIHVNFASKPLVNSSYSKSTDVESYYTNNTRMFPTSTFFKRITTDRTITSPKSDFQAIPTCLPICNCEKECQAKESSPVLFFQGSISTIILLSISCVSVLVNIILITCKCLRIKRNKFKVPDKGQDTIRFAPPEVAATRNEEGIVLTTIVPISSQEILPERAVTTPRNEDYERMSDESVSSSVTGTTAAGMKKPEAHSTQLEHVYQELNNINLIDKQVYQTLDRTGDVVAQVEPTAVTQEKYEPLKIAEQQSSEYQKLHIYSNI